MSDDKTPGRRSYEAFRVSMRGFACPWPALDDELRAAWEAAAAAVLAGAEPAPNPPANGMTADERAVWCAAYGAAFNDHIDPASSNYELAHNESTAVALSAVLTLRIMVGNGSALQVGNARVPFAIEVTP